MDQPLIVPEGTAYVFNSCGGQVDGLERNDNCGSSDSLFIPASVKNISELAFAFCFNINTITFEEDSELSFIGPRAFERTGVEAIHFPAKLESLGANAFEQCDALTSVTFAEDSALQTLGYKAFADCGNLTSFEFVEGLKSIGEQVFRMECSNSTCLPPGSPGRRDASPGGLTAAALPASLVSIGVEAFKNCEDLKNVTFAAGSNLESIGQEAFEYCVTLGPTVDLPGKLTSIGDQAFKDCEALETVTFAECGFCGGSGESEETKAAICDRDCGCCSTGPNCAEVPTPLSRSTVCPARSNLTSIGDEAFQNCVTLGPTVWFPASLTSIGERAFQDCVDLTNIAFDGLACYPVVPGLTIGNDAFDGSGVQGELLPYECYD
jgi:hypothetical protein